MPSETNTRKRRDKGDGSLFQRADGKWVAQLRIGTKENGKPKLKSFVNDTRQEAKKRLDEYKKAIIKNDYREIKKRTVRDYMDDWLYNTLKLKGKSLDIKELSLRNHVYPYIGDMQIASLGANDIQRMVNALIDKEYSYSTIKKAYDAVNQCFKLALIKEEIHKNPCLGVVLPKNTKKKAEAIRFFNDAEIELIKSECVSKHKNGASKYRLGYGVVLLLYTGMRIGEAIPLSWEKVDFANKRIFIDCNAVEIVDRSPNAKTKTRIEVQDTPKTEASIRHINLGKTAIEALEELKKLNGGHKYVLANSNGGLLQYRNFNRMLESILERCNIEPCGSHTCRHTFASMLIRKGVDIKVVSELLGHADVSTTYNIYVHLINEQKQQAIEMLDEL
jgi:integrase